MHALPPTTRLLLALLAGWRITHLLWAEDGPGGVLARLRRVAGQGFWGQLLDCFYCLSLWVAAPMALVLGGGWLERGFWWAALSGGASLLERATARRSGPPPAALWHEQSLSEPDASEDHDHVMLR